MRMIREYELTALSDQLHTGCPMGGEKQAYVRIQIPERRPDLLWWVSKPKSWNRLCSFFHSPVLSSLVGKNVQRKPTRPPPKHVSFASSVETGLTEEEKSQAGERHHGVHPKATELMLPKGIEGHTGAKCVWPLCCEFAPFEVTAAQIRKIILASQRIYAADIGETAVCWACVTFLVWWCREKREKLCWLITQGQPDQDKELHLQNCVTRLLLFSAWGSWWNEYR